MDLQAEKIFAGARLRRLRRERGLTQADAADLLGLSPSYLNLLERNQRPVTARVLLALAQAFDIDVRSLAEGSDRQLITDLEAAAADPALAALELDRTELTELAETQPRAAEALTQMHQAYRSAAESSADLAAQLQGGDQPGRLNDTEAVRNAIDRRNNYFAAIEAAADEFGASLKLTLDNRVTVLEERLKTEHGIVVRTFEDAVMGGARQRMDFHTRRLMLSDRLSPLARPMQLATTMALLEFDDLLDRQVKDAGLETKAEQALYRMGLARYFAGALLAPYETFLTSAEKLRYDIESLQRQFGLGFEATCHRLTTLHRPDRSGIPFFMVRIDPAGNVSKRFGSGVLPFARSGGSCPKWSLFEAFRAQERLHTQRFALPDNSEYLSIAKAVSRPAGPNEPPVLQAVAVGCEWARADETIFADALLHRTATPVGITCRLCERAACSHRAFPSMQREMSVNPWRQAAGPYASDEL
ncbi:short-chain fatty acyl-CoA regulator family protein [Hyphobacterium sp. HN65]|uniref:Short-chain fatty acyl-CoA regulator family protein n=1 Tax=Hyphobacterium lacteum TaxID=3116575 RepID=A0ABU7LQ78_9PROT|nr:short-chain fatty acyl-CoA regulator family protein [Hyphobacterium sp. HN65]MEE2525781.1 short-chain fatty acyl-CoA regulator family protein [Hyphobacterium sp. HN65]